jgi:hypothetical protein
VARGHPLANPTALATAAKQSSAAKLGLSDSALRRFLRTGRARSHTWHQAQTLAVCLARTTRLEDHPRGPIPDDDSLLYLAATQEGHVLRRCDSCGTELHGR